MAKFRHGFVSNSSSSSFVVIGNGNLEMKDQLVGEGWEAKFKGYGEYEFGWQNEEYSDVFSRANFAFLQAYSIGDVRRQQWLDMIEEVIKEHTGAMYVISGFELEDGHDWLKSGYIDHASAACEGENIAMFESKEALKNFIFSGGSYIQCGNDN